MGLVFSIPFIALGIMTGAFGILCLSEMSEVDEKLLYSALGVAMLAVAAICLWIGGVTLWLF